MILEDIKNNKRLFAGEKKPSMKRRKEGHDYHGERFYMITLAVEGRKPVLGRIEGNTEEGNVRMVLSPLGEAVRKEWMRTSTVYPQVAVIGVQVMPDHIHGILYFREQTQYHLGQVIKGFKLGCNRALREMIVAMRSQPTREGERKDAVTGLQPTREGERKDAVTGPQPTRTICIC
jgi:hypothetical protein